MFEIYVEIAWDIKVDGKRKGGINELHVSLRPPLGLRRLRVGGLGLTASAKNSCSGMGPSRRGRIFVPFVRIRTPLNNGVNIYPLMQVGA